MNKILLISANLAMEPYPVYPLGMSTVAAATAAAGYEVAQFDWLRSGPLDGWLEPALRRHQPDIIGISIRNVDNVDSLSSHRHWYLGDVKKLVRNIRSISTAPVFAGGAGFSLMAEEILDYTGIDYGVTGEGEETATCLVRSLMTGKKVPRIWRAPALPLAGGAAVSPLYDPDLVAFYGKRSGVIGVQTKRGCPYRCSYCSYPALEGRSLRFRSPEAVVEEILHLKTKHGIRQVTFVDAVFNDPAERYIETAELLIKRNVDIRWSAFFRPQGLDLDVLKLLKRSGLCAMELGTDAATDATLEGIDKGFDFSGVLRFGSLCGQAGIPHAHFIIFGGPGETPDTVQEGIRNIDRLNRCVVFIFSGIRILPGTALHHQACAEGVIDGDTPLLQPRYYFSPRVDPHALNRTLESAFKKRRDRIFPPEEGQLRLDAMATFGYRGLLWDRLLPYAESLKNRHKIPDWSV